PGTSWARSRRCGCCASAAYRSSRSTTGCGSRRCTPTTSPTPTPKPSSARRAARYHGVTVPVPTAALRAGAAATWRARLQPVDPGWVALALGAPLMNTDRAHNEWNWTPSIDADQAIDDLIAGMAHHAHTDGPPLTGDPTRPGRLRGVLRGRVPGTGNPY